MRTTVLAFAVLVFTNLNGLRASEEKCCPDIGCFSNAPPYNHLPLPQCPEEMYLKLDIKLYTRQNPNKGEEFSKTVFPNSFNASRRLMFIVHGFTQSGVAEWMHDIKDATLTKEDSNVVIVSWPGGAQTLNLPQACADTRTVGAEIALLAQKAIDKGLPRTSLYCVGHSLGGQVCGFAGNTLKFGRITGLDPASVIVFEADRIGLNQSSADFVDVIHTSTQTYILIRIGVARAIGHVDFYPNGGKTQTGCKGLDATIDPMDILDSPSPNDLLEVISLAGPFCDHMKAVYYYLESILTPCFVARYSCLNEDNPPLTCTKSNVNVQNMGFDTSPNSPRGIFYLQTNAYSAFCQG